MRHFIAKLKSSKTKPVSLKTFWANYKIIKKYKQKWKNEEILITWNEINQTLQNVSMSFIEMIMALLNVLDLIH